MHPDWIQLHGNETPQRVVQARGYAKRGVIKALPVADASDLDAVKAFDRIADMILVRRQAAEKRRSAGRARHGL